MAARHLRTIRIEGNTAYVPLTKGYESVIDAADVPLIERYNWQAFARERRSDQSLLIYATAYSFITEGPRVRLLLHRLISPAPKGFVVDHINGDGLDNRRQNLRVVTQSHNIRNRRPREDGAVSGVRQYEVGKWEITWGMAGFLSYEEAVEARNKLKLFMDSTHYPRRYVQPHTAQVAQGGKP